jgi:hypothetical protein
MGSRWGRASRAGTVMMVRRSVASRATAWPFAGDDAGGAQQVVDDSGAQYPCGVGAEPAGRYVC